MKILELFKAKEMKTDFSSFFSKPIGQQKKVIKFVIKEANKEQKEMYNKYKSSNSKLKTI